MALEKFSDIPIRANGQKIEASWFNTLRLLLVQIFGDISGEEQQSIGDADTNQPITALSDISSQEFSKVDIEYMVRRKDDTYDLLQASKFITLHYKETSDLWSMHGDQENIQGDDAKIEFDLFQQDVAGDKQATLRYSTTALGGGGIHEGDIKVRSKKWII